MRGLNFKRNLILFLNPSLKQKLLLKYFVSVTLKAPYIVILPLNSFTALQGKNPKIAFIQKVLVKKF